MLDVEDMYNHFDDLKFNNIDNIFDTIYNLPEEDLQGLVELSASTIVMYQEILYLTFQLMQVYLEVHILAHALIVS